MTFAANAGLIWRGAFVPSRFRYRERAGEEPFFTAWFRQRGFRILQLDGEHRFEGAGDALFVGGKLFAGYYYRTDVHTHERIGALLGVRVCSLELIKPRFYHLDTCFSPLGTASAICHRGAFDSYGLRVIREHVEDPLYVGDDDAYEFGCNAVVVGRKAIIAEPCHSLARALRKRGYTVCRLKFSEFIKAGGAARCLTLRLDEGGHTPSRHLPAGAALAAARSMR
jgi:N-dimethylarginine dimethylaminohydrolase